MCCVLRARIGRLLLLTLALTPACGRIGFGTLGLDRAKGDGFPRTRDAGNGALDGAPSDGGRGSFDGAAGFVNGGGRATNGSGGTNGAGNALGGGAAAGSIAPDASSAAAGNTSAGGAAAAAGAGTGSSSASGGTTGNGGVSGAGGAFVGSDAGAAVEISTAVGAWGIATDGTNVYWTDKDGGTVNQRAAAGGAITVLAPSELNPCGIAVDATHVYWVSFSNPGSVRRAPIGGGTVETVQPGVSWAEHLALVGGYAYWADQGSGTAPVNRTATSGGAITAFAPSERFPYDVAGDGTDLFWTSFTKTGGVRAAPNSGGAARDVVTSLNTPSALALFGSDVYVAVNIGGTIVRVPKAGGTATVLASSQPKPYDIAVDASGIYWTNQGDESVRMLAPGSTTPVTLATNTDNVRFIATDASAVYWTTATAVMRLVK